MHLYSVSVDIALVLHGREDVEWEIDVRRAQTFLHVLL